MRPAEEYDSMSIQGEEVFAEIKAEKDPVKRASLINQFETIAQKLRVKTQFDRTLRSLESEWKKEAMEISLLESYTNFTDCPYQRLRCGPWIAADDGISIMVPGQGVGRVYACRHPIIPIMRMKNIQTGEEQIRLAFRRGGKWQEVTVPKTTTTQAGKIVELAAKSINVTSENARLLVRFLSDVEAENELEIPVVRSSAKMGWTENTFLPYDKTIEFDGENRFQQTYDSIHPEGDREAWYEHVRYLRSLGKIEINFLLAASFASVLFELTGVQPFFVDLWGETGNGKTVTLMLAASVWADPQNKAYMKDYESTDVGLEALANFLNNLPVILDDTSKRNQYVEKKFESIVYTLCSGKGRLRSNRTIGMNNESRWKTIMLTNGEKPLSGYANQGGAINRILELESQSDIYPDPQWTVSEISKSYGHAGKDFVKIVKRIGAEKVREMQKAWQEEIMKDKKAQKQSIALSIIMAADRIATEMLFKDGNYIDIEKAKQVLLSQEEVSDGVRCYEYIVGKVGMNPSRFDPETRVEKWGMLSGNYAVFYSQALKELCEEGGFSMRAFLSWAKKSGAILLGNDGCPGRVGRIHGEKPAKHYYIDLTWGSEPDEGDPTKGDSLDGGPDGKNDLSNLNFAKFVNYADLGDDNLPFE